MGNGTAVSERSNDDYIDNKILAPIEEISLTTPIENADGGFSEKSLF